MASYLRGKVGLKNVQNHQTNQCLNTGRFLKNCLGVSILAYVICVTKMFTWTKPQVSLTIFPKLRGTNLQKDVQNAKNIDQFAPISPLKGMNKTLELLF